MMNEESLPVHLRQAGAWHEEDVTIEQIADVYAQAILGAAEEAGRTKTVLEEFDSLIEDIFERFPEWEAILTSPRVSQEEKSASIERIFRGRASDVFIEALKVLSRHGRFDTVRSVRRRLRVHWERRQHQIRVEVQSAVPLRDQELEQIRQVLRAKLADEPILLTKVDPQLIGGLVIRVGDVIYDGSVANQLERIRRRMIQRSAQKFSLGR